MLEDYKTYVDLDSGLNRVRGNKGLYHKMLGMFLRSEEFDAFETALAEGDNARASDIAHAIKGMTGNLSFTLLFEHSTALMNQLRQGDADPATLANYRDAYVQTRKAVEALSAELLDET